MSANRFIAIHCCQEKYIQDIIINGIERQSKAVFIYDFEERNEKKLLNTLAVLIYHGIGINGWKSILNNQLINNNEFNLQIVLASFSNEQQRILQNERITNYYRICNGEQTLEYCKIKDIGKIEKICSIKKINVTNINIKNRKNINPEKERFFIKDTYNNDIDCNNKTIQEMRDICYKLAIKNIDSLKKIINNIKKEYEKSAKNRRVY